jgi:hypothetical protein
MCRIRKKKNGREFGWKKAAAKIDQLLRILLSQRTDLSIVSK